MRPTGQVPGPYEDTTCQMVVAYGRSDHPHLETIRRFRDTVLSHSSGGRTLIDRYYATAPSVAGIARRSRLCRAAVKYAVAAPAYLVAALGLRLRR